jgi:hypothetical protein
MKSLGHIIVALSWLVFAVASRGEEPYRTYPVPDDGVTLLQAKPDTKDKKVDPDKKGKEKKVPELALDRPLMSPEGPLDFTPRELPLAPEMLGDQLPLRVPGPVPVRGAGVPAAAGGAAPGSVLVVPGTRDFKVADNGSPRPQDRVYFGFQYFNDCFGATNRAIGAAVSNVVLYREYIGMEKSFLDGNASFELRMPMNTLGVDGTPTLDGRYTALGDLSMVLRYALLRDRELDNWFTAGLAVTTPTGPGTLGGIGVPNPSHSTVLQPFVAYLYNRGDLYLQGFSAFDIPTDVRDTTLWYNDVGIGYFIYRTPDYSRFLTAVAPAFEVHIATPLNNRGGPVAGNLLSAVDEVNLSMVANLQFASRTRLSVGVVTPVTGPQPFTIEGVVQLRFRF